MTHRTISPAILYFGTPTLLLTTTNPDDTTYNVAPMSSAWWLGHRCVLGLGAMQHSFGNMMHTKKVVLNMPDDSPEMVAAVNRLARTTGTPEPSAWKLQAGYKYVSDKWTHSGLTPQPSEVAGMPPRIQECPVQMEAEVIAAHPMMTESNDLSGATFAIEVKILKVHVRPDWIMPGHDNRVDPDKVKPVFVVFQEFYGMKPGRLGKSRLADVQEEMYRKLTDTNPLTEQEVDTEEPGLDLARGISHNQ